MNTANCDVRLCSVPSGISQYHIDRFTVHVGFRFHQLIVLNIIFEFAALRVEFAILLT